MAFLDMDRSMVEALVAATEFAGAFLVALALAACRSVEYMPVE